MGDLTPVPRNILIRGEVSPQREAAIRAELGIVQTPEEQTDLRYELRERFRRSLEAHYGEVWGLRREIDKAKEALHINARARFLRVGHDLPVIDLYPDTQEELDELMATSLALLCEKLPAKCRLWPRLTNQVVTEHEPAIVGADPPVVTAAPTTSTNPPIAFTDAPLYCAFVNGSRPKVGEKYILRCDGGEFFLALGEYVGGGVFTFSAYEPHLP